MSPNGSNKTWIQAIGCMEKNISIREIGWSLSSVHLRIEMVRWTEKRQQYDFFIQYSAGRNHKNEKLFSVDFVPNIVVQTFRQSRRTEKYSYISIMDATW